MEEAAHRRKKKRRGALTTRDCNERRENTRPLSREEGKSVPWSFSLFFQRKRAETPSFQIGLCCRRVLCWYLLVFGALCHHDPPAAKCRFLSQERKTTEREQWRLQPKQENSSSHSHSLPPASMRKFISRRNLKMDGRAAGWSPQNGRANLRWANGFTRLASGMEMRMTRGSKLPRMPSIMASVA